MKRRSFFAMAVILVLCLAFSGCDIKMSSVEGLMRPPKLSGTSSYLQTAFEESVGEKVLMKTPISGDNRSSYMLYDIDKDGVDEGLVFYSIPGVDDNAYVSIFKQTEGVWSSVSSIKGRGEEIYEVDFADINGDGQYEIAISWTSYGGAENKTGNSFSSSDRTLTIYGYSGSSVTLIITESFTNMLLCDLNGDKAEELFLVNLDLSNQENRTVGRILSFNNEYSVVKDEIFAMTGIIDVFNMTTDSFTVDEQAHSRIFLDGGISETGVITEVIDVLHDTFQISLPLYVSNISENSLTIRNIRTFCTDIDGDGIVEIPTPEALPSGVRIDDKEGNRSQLNLTVWSELEGEQLTVDKKCLLNSAYGYMFNFPDEWLEIITAVYNNNNATLTFYKLDDEGTLAGEIFSLRAFSELKWEDNNYGYSKLDTHGAFVYGYSYVGNQETVITKDDIIDNFVILN
ncbi:MAG: hypothetical protein J1F23_01710 [Oscillospiraceae bacterium]|nr:hypothetical protein [Oscillospiraceae bacterium]